MLPLCSIKLMQYDRNALIFTSLSYSVVTYILALHLCAVLTLCTFSYIRLSSGNSVWTILRNFGY